MLVHLANEVGDLTKEVTELWTFFSEVLDSMTKRMELLKKSLSRWSMSLI